MISALLRWLFGWRKETDLGMAWDESEMDWYWRATGERVTWEEWREYHRLPGD